jgi:hypothetical protein
VRLGCSSGAGPAGFWEVIARGTVQKVEAMNYTGGQYWLILLKNQLILPDNVRFLQRGYKLTQGNSFTLFHACC